MNYTKKNNKKNNITKNKRKIISNQHNVSIQNNFKEIINLVKMYNWNVDSKMKQKLKDENYNELDKNLEKFAKELLNSREDKILKKIDKDLTRLIKNVESNVKDKIYKFRVFLKNINHYFSNKKFPSLFLTRDDLLRYINEFLYLISFDK